MKNRLMLAFLVSLLCMPCGAAVDCFHTPHYVGGALVPWHIDADGPFHYIMDIEAQWWLNTPDVNGWPAYLTAAELYRNHSQMDNGAVPGSACSMAMLAYLKYYAYTGNVQYLNMVRVIGNYIIQQGLTPGTYSAYPDFPWAVGRTGDITPDGSGHPNNSAGQSMPDKGAMIGTALVRLFQATGDSAYLNAAMNIADALAANAVTGNATQSPWPFRANAQTGAYVDGRICGNQIFAVRLFDALMELGTPGSGGYASVRANVWNWLKTYAIPDTSGNMWQDFFEDHSGNEDNPTQIDALETARYLLEKKDALDSQWSSMVATIITTVKNHWVVHTSGYTAIGEQEADMTPYNSHTARYASILAMYCEAGGPAAYKDEAYSSFAYSTYSVDDDGFADTYFGNEIAWTTDSYGDWMLHFMDGLAAMPEWAPNNSSHLLRSSSVVRSVTYETDRVWYAVFGDSGQEKLKLNFVPVAVLVNGTPVSSWVWDGASMVCMVNRTNGDSVEISATNTSAMHPQGASAEYPISICPNPINPAVLISLEGRYMEPLRSAIYNLSGRMIVDLSNRLINGRCIWDASGQASGTYVVRVTVDGRSLQKKVTLIK